MLRRKSIALALTTMLLGALTAPAAHSVEIAENPWLGRRILNIAHQGGEIEAPSKHSLLP